VTGESILLEQRNRPRNVETPIAFLDHF